MTGSWIRGWRASGLAALFAVLCALPGLIALPTVDRNEAVFAQGTVQMLDERNPAEVRFQDNVRPGSMPGAHWLQAATVTAFSGPEARAIWVYRLPSLLGLIVLVIAAVKGGERLFGARIGLWSGLATGTGALGLTLADLATADALFAGAAAAMVSAFAYVYLADGAQRVRRRDRIVFWVGLIAAFLIKGPMILGLVILAGGTLAIADRGAPWLKGLRPVWGLIALAAVAGPWLMAVTVSTDGQFWQGAPNLTRTGFGLHTAMAPLLLFPAGFLAPFALWFGWRERRAPSVRLTLAWLVPAWIALELLPGFQLHGAAGLYIALIWLGCAGAASGNAPAWVRWIAAILAAAGALVIAGAAFALGFGLEGDKTPFMAAVAGLLALAAGGAGVGSALRAGRRLLPPAAIVLGALTGALMLGIVVPGASSLWPTRNLLDGLAAAGLDPRGGLARGPVASAGYEEPSLVFHLGASTELGDAHTAAAALADNRPAIVSADQLRATNSLLATHGRTARTVYRFRGYDPAGATSVDLYILKANP